MNRPRLIKGLRIAWTVWWGIVCVLLVVLWVRSYWRRDWLQGERTNVWSMQGQLTFVIDARSADWKLSTNPISDFKLLPSGKWGWESNFRSTLLYFPHFLPVIAFAILAAAPWIHWSKQFTLKTVLIATTLIAIVLGLIVYSLRE